MSAPARAHAARLRRRSVAALGAALGVLLGLAGAPRASRADAPSDWVPELVTPQPLTVLDLNVFPMLFYTPETRLGYGAGTWLVIRDRDDDPHAKPDNVWLSAVYTQEGQTIVQVIPELYFADEIVRLKLILRYLNFPTRFYGIGNDTPAESEESYTALTRSARLNLSRRVWSRLSVGILGDYDDTDVSDLESGGALAGGTVPGSEGSELGGLGLAAFWDSREHHFNPRDGAFWELSLLRYKDRLGDAYDFTRRNVDLRWYLPVLDTHVLGLQVVYQAVAGTAPFTALPRLGGKFLFRGLYEGRYRDRQLLAAQGEYRLPIAGRWGAVAFLAYGDVAETAEDFHLPDFKTAAGLGLRFAYNRIERINVRLDVAAADEEVAVYFSVGEAF